MMFTKYARTCVGVYRFSKTAHTRRCSGRARANTEFMRGNGMLRVWKLNVFSLCIAAIKVRKANRTLYRRTNSCLCSTRCAWTMVHTPDTGRKPWSNANCESICGPHNRAVRRKLFAFLVHSGEPIFHCNWAYKRIRSSVWNRPFWRYDLMDLESRGEKGLLSRS